MKRFNRISFLFVIIILTGLFVRLWGIKYDLPYIYHPDEPWPIRIGHQMLVTGDFNPHFFDWPAFIIYLNMFIQAAYHLFGRIFNLGTPLASANPLIELGMGVTYSTEPAIVILGRLGTVVAGMGTIAVTILAGKKLFHNFIPGALAGIFLAISPTNVNLDRFITPDTYATFFLSLAFLSSVFIYQEGKTWAYILAGLSLGLAVSSKYNSGLIIIVILAGHILRYGWRGLKDYRLFLALILGGIFFAAVNPYTWLDFRNFYTKFLLVNKHYSTGHAGMEGNTLKWYIGYMWKTAGIIYILAMAEIIRSIHSRAKEMILLSIFPIVYFIFISTYVVRNDRTFLPLTPFLFLLAASFLMWLLKKVNEKTSRSVHFYSNLAVKCLIILFILLPATKMITNTIHMTTINSRETARVWIDNNLPKGTRIGIESYSPFVDPSKFSVQSFGRMIDHELEWYSEQGFEYLVFSQGMYGRFYQEPTRYSVEVSEYEALFAGLRPVKIFTDRGYEVRIYQTK